MNKKLTIGITTVACAAILGFTVYAATLGNINLFSQTGEEYDEIATVMKESEAIDSYLAPENNESSDIINAGESNNGIRRAPQNFDIENCKKIKLFTANITNSSASVYDSLNDQNEHWLAVIEENGKVGYAYLKKGIKYEDVASKINQLNISDEWKNEMLETVREREGKWYVEKIENEKDDSQARNFVSEEYITELLSDSGITNVVDAKYVYINNFMPAICVKTDSGEYIIPHFGGTRNDGINSNTVYSINDFINLFLN